MLKQTGKRNQMIIAALAVMIAVAGYLNYSGKMFGEGGKTQETGGELASQELLDISEEDSMQTGGDIESIEDEVADAEVEGNPGEAVLTSAGASMVVAQAKVNREQVRAKSKETLQAIIDDDKISESQKADAIAQLVSMTEIMEKEVAIETLLASKGFKEAVVSLTEDSADIVVNNVGLTESGRAQIEDIVTRKAGIHAANVVITPIHVEKESEESTDGK